MPPYSNSEKLKVRSGYDQTRLFDENHKKHTIGRGVIAKNSSLYVDGFFVFV